MLVQRRSRRLFLIDAEETDVVSSFESVTQIKLMYKEVVACPTSKERGFFPLWVSSWKILCLNVYGLIDYFELILKKRLKIKFR